MADTLPLSNKVQQSSKHGREHSIISATYGDGFEQIAEWGANAKKDNWRLEWRGLEIADRDAIFNAYDLTTTWNWTAPGDSVEKQWRYTGKYSETNVGSLYNIRLNIKQVYDL